MSMKIVVTSVFVEDQDKALKFYTEKLGFVKKQDFLLENLNGSPLSHPKIETEPSCYLNQMTILLLKSIKRDSLHRAYP